MTVDDQFTAGDIASLASRFRSFDPSQFETYALPVYSDMAGDASIVRLLDREAEPILDIFRGVATAGAGDPSSVQVDVLNGTGRTDEGRTTGDSLLQAGFDVGDIGDAATFGAAQTTVRYRSDERAAADVLASYLVVTPQLVQDDTLEGNGVQLDHRPRLQRRPGRSPARARRPRSHPRRRRRPHPAPPRRRPRPHASASSPATARTASATDSAVSDAHRSPDEGRGGRTGRR